LQQCEELLGSLLLRRFLTAPDTNAPVCMIQGQLHMERLLMRGTFGA